MNLVPAIQGFARTFEPGMIEIRRHLHSRPELSENEYATTEYLSQRVTALGLSPVLAGDHRGLCVDVGDVGTGGRIAIRGDIDALPIQTTLETCYASTVDGVMHACGHDAHAAIVWGTLAILSELRRSHMPTPEIAARGIFQPAEETSTGGKHMIEAGALDGVEAALALHIDPARTVGTMGVRDGILTAGCDVFECTFRGRSGHGARPHLSGDTVDAVASWIHEVYRRVPRVVDARDAVVVNVGQVHGGTAANVVPAELQLAGTLRCLTARGGELAKEQMRRTGAAIASTHDCQIDLRFGQHTPPVNNDPRVNGALRSAAVDVVGLDNVEAIDQPSMGAEDFAFIAQNVSSAMMRLGTAGAGIGDQPLHTPGFDIDESALAFGATALSLAVIRIAAQHD